MIPFALLLSVAILAGWQVGYGLILAFWGGPGHWSLHVLGVVGVVVVLVAAYASAWSRPVGFKVALFGLFAIAISFVTWWPALIAAPGDRAIPWYFYVPAVAVVIAAGYVVVGLRRPGATLLYPACASRSSKIGLLVSTGVLVAVFAWFMIRPG